MTVHVHNDRSSTVYTNVGGVGGEQGGYKKVGRVRGGEEEEEGKERRGEGEVVVITFIFFNNYLHIFENAWCGQGVCFSYHTVLKLSMVWAWCVYRV